MFKALASLSSLPLRRFRFNSSLKYLITALTLLTFGFAFLVFHWRENWLTGHAADGNTISGVVFQDYNANGVRDLNNPTVNGGSSSIDVALDRAIAGTVVTAYGINNVVAGTATTDEQGSFVIKAGIPGPYRIEFSNFPGNFKPGPSGPDSKSTVQFVKDGSSNNISLGLVDPADFCQDNPKLATVFSREEEAIGAQVGATWGAAYARSSNQLYLSAYMKRHAAFGSGGTGAIYRIDRANPGSASVYADLNEIFGSRTAGANPHSRNDLERDNEDMSWDAVGKVSLGQMAISGDEEKLYVVNLADRAVYQIPLNDTPNSSNIRRRSVPAGLPGCPSTSDIRPFAVSYENDRVYVGMICSAESTISARNPEGDASRLQAYVYTLNPSSFEFSEEPVFQVSLNYPRRCTDGLSGRGNCLPEAWRPWAPTSRNIGSEGREAYPQPMLTDIGFERGNLIIGLRDRSGDQFGIDPQAEPDTLLDAGTQWINNRTGGSGRLYRIYRGSRSSAAPATAKALGLSDLISLCDGAPIEIGNRVWQDTDGDGLQDADEIPIGNIRVNLYQGGVLVGATTTNGFGEFYFNAKNVDGGLKPNTSYEIRVSTQQVLLSGYTLTRKDVDAGDNGDSRDSDAAIAGSSAVIAVTTGGAGESNHTYDIGFIPPGGPLTIACGTDMTVTTVNGKDAVVSYPRPAATGQGATVVCAPASGSSFPLGTTSVNCRASNAAGVVYCNFSVKVVLPPPPTLDCPADMVVTVRNPVGATIDYPRPRVSDPNARLSCNPAAGSLFAAGTTPVNCIAINAGGSGSCGFNVTVKAPPDITCPTNQVVVSPSPTKVEYRRPSVIGVGVTTVCDPASGSIFQMGNTRVNCTSTNETGSDSCGFILRVTATPPPVISCPTDVSAYALKSTGAPVAYAAPVATAGSSITCSRPSGSRFPVGSTPVTCTATRLGESSDCSFNVNVSQISNRPGCNLVCFLSPQYYLLNLDRLPPGSVVIGGYNGNSPVSTANLKVVADGLRDIEALTGAATPRQQFNQEFVAAQLNLLAAGSPSSPSVILALKSKLSCYALNFPAVTLSNGVTISSSSTLGDLFTQGQTAIRSNRAVDLQALTRIFDLLNGNDPLRRCGE